MIEQIWAPATMEGGEGLLATLVYHQHKSEGDVQFVTEPCEPQQVAVMRHSRGKHIAPHRHHERLRNVTRTTEVLIIRRGSVLINLYTSEGDWVTSHALVTGDLIVLHAGAHSLFFQEDTELVEVKQGPYAGRESDKVEIQVTQGAHDAAPRAA